MLSNFVQLPVPGSLIGHLCDVQVLLVHCSRRNLIFFPEGRIEINSFNKYTLSKIIPLSFLRFSSHLEFDKIIMTSL